MKKVTVKYFYMGSFDRKNAEGVVLDNKVLVADAEGIGLYEFQATNEPNTVIINLDVCDTDYLDGKAELLLDLISA